MAELLFEFYDIFPNESLVFLTEDDGFILSDPELTIKGLSYSPSWKYLFNEQLEEVFIEPDYENHQYYLAA